MSTLFPIQIDIIVRTSTLTRGEYVVTETPGTITGSVQPLPNRADKDMKDLPTGRVDYGRLRVYTSSRLKVGVEGGAGVGDIVVWEGYRYEVVREITYQMRILPCYKYICELVPAEPGT